MDWSNLMTSIAQVLIFMMFINAIIEVIKGFSAVGLFGLLKGIVKSIWSNDHALTGDQLKVLNFFLALLACWLFDYGIMTHVLQMGAKMRPAAGFFDYIGTASLVYMGADWIFDYIKKSRAQLKAAAEDPEKSPAVQ